MSEFAWLIEAPGPNYLAVRTLTNRSDFVWTNDANAAIRFMSEKQADDTMTALRYLSRDLFSFDGTLGPARAVEHGWIDVDRESRMEASVQRFGERLTAMLEGAERRIGTPYGHLQKLTR